MSNEQITNEQKAIDIAQWDGWEKPAPHSTFYRNGYRHLKNFELTKYYLTDLNYLVPVAVNLHQQLPTNDIWGRLYDAYTELTKTSEGTYQQLFDAVYEAIVYFENQNS